MMTSLKSRKGATVVLDAGIATKDNLIWLKEAGYHYLVCHRGHINEDKISSIMKHDPDGTQIKQGVSVHRQVEDDHVNLLCKSIKRLEKNRDMYIKQDKLFCDKIAHLVAGLALPKRTKKYDAILKSIGRIIEKYPKAAKSYKIDVAKTDETGLATSISLTRIRSIESDTDSQGLYCIKTSHLDYDSKTIWTLYHQLNQVEQAFRTMKSHLGFRPIFHQLEHRIDAHLYIAVLAYRLSHAIEFQLKQHGITYSWHTIRTMLLSHQRYTLQYTVIDPISKQKSFVSRRLNSTPSRQQIKLYTALGLAGNPLPRSSWLIPNSKL